MDIIRSEKLVDQFIRLKAQLANTSCNKETETPKKWRMSRKEWLRLFKEDVDSMDNLMNFESLLRAAIEPSMSDSCLSDLLHDMGCGINSRQITGLMSGKKATLSLKEAIGLINILLWKERVLNGE